MANLFFGTFKTEEQFEGHYCDATLEWFNNLQEGDYVFLINKDIKGLWKTTYTEQIENGFVRTHFDPIIKDFGKQFLIKDLIAIKEFELNVDLVVKTSRSTPIGFYPIVLLHPDNIENFLEPSSFKKYITNSENYRKVYFLQSKSDIKNDSEDIQFYKDGNDYLLFASKFIDKDMLGKYKLGKVSEIKNFYKDSYDAEKRASRKLKTIDFIDNALLKKVPITKEEQSILNFYDIFFSDVELKHNDKYVNKNKIEKQESSDVKDNNTIQKEFSIPENINTILYGPPGTGKTFITKQRAVSICTGNKPSEDTNSIYEQLVKEGKVDFVTFHQSFGYEEFVEGIKPILSDNEDETLNYEIKDGILKVAAINASYEYVRNKNNKLEDTFDNRWDQMLSEMTAKLESDDKEARKFQTRSGSNMTLEEITINGNLKFKVTDIPYTVSRNRTRRLWNAFPDVKKVENIDRDFRAVIGGANSTSYYIALEYLQNMKFESKSSVTVSDENLSLEEKKKAVADLTNEDYKKVGVKNHLLIIDEINRGNVAQIFGELITLIEKSKRAGSDNALKIKLAYSGEDFILPPNLYILGTMNTADRSVEALDAALRRRFAFEELAPNIGKLEAVKVVDDNNEILEIDLSSMLQIMNNRLEYLLDHDHTIGHAYFMPDIYKNEDGNDVIKLSSLRNIFKNSVIPQLKEYFYNDWQKIRMVLSPEFISERKEIKPSTLFFEQNDGYFDDDKKLYNVTDSASWNENTFISIYDKDYKNKMKQDEE